MQLRKDFCALGFCVWAICAHAQGRAVSTVDKISVLSQSPLQIQVQTSRPIAPQVQIVNGPDRLVIDVPNSTPGPHLHALTLARGEARQVRFSRYASNPAVTRVVVDLNGPEWYRVEPNASGLLVSVGGGESHGVASPAIGWLSAGGGGFKVAPVVQAAPVQMKKAAAPYAANGNGAMVQYANGQLTIHANNATLSEVLFQIQKITGAEIAIPSGTEQERVAADFGPGTASEVLGELLNGTGLNFVVVGSAADPNQLRSVILTRKTGEADPPSAFASVNQEQASAPVIEPDNPELAGPPPDQVTPQPPQPVQPQGPPPEVVPNQ